MEGILNIVKITQSLDYQKSLNFENFQINALRSLGELLPFFFTVQNSENVGNLVSFKLVNNSNDKGYLLENSSIITKTDAGSKTFYFLGFQALNIVASVYYYLIEFENQTYMGEMFEIITDKNSIIDFLDINKGEFDDGLLYIESGKVNTTTVLNKNFQ